jgi:hypothetical protein
LLDAFSSFVVYIFLGFFWGFFLSVWIVPTSKSFEFPPQPPNFNTWDKEGDTKVPNPQKFIK